MKRKKNNTAAEFKETGDDIKVTQELEDERSGESGSDPDFTGYTDDELKGVRRILVVSAPTSPTACSLPLDVDSPKPQLPRKRANSIGENRPPRLPPRNIQKSSLKKNEVVKIGSPSRSTFGKSVQEIKSRALKKISKN